MLSSSMSGCGANSWPRARHAATRSAVGAALSLAARAPTTGHCATAAAHPPGRPAPASGLVRPVVDRQPSSGVLDPSEHALERRGADGMGVRGRDQHRSRARREVVQHRVRSGRAGAARQRRGQRLLVQIRVGTRQHLGRDPADHRVDELLWRERVAIAAGPLGVALADAGHVAGHVERPGGDAAAAVGDVEGGGSVGAVPGAGKRRHHPGVAAGGPPAALDVEPQGRRVGTIREAYAACREDAVRPAPRIAPAAPGQATTATIPAPRRAA